MAVITISRQCGSGGDEVAGLVAETLKYRIFGKKMIARMANEVGLTADEIVDFSEEDHEVQNFLARLVGRRGSSSVAQVRTWTEDINGRKTQLVRELDEDDATALVRHAIETAYKWGNVVIVGRGGQAILNQTPGVLHVRIEAPLQARAEYLRDREEISLALANETAKKRDTAAADYLKRYYKVDWSDPLLYHLILNTGRWEIEAAADLIVHAVGHVPVEAPSGDHQARI